MRVAVYLLWLGNNESILIEAHKCGSLRRVASEHELAPFHPFLWQWIGGSSHILGPVAGECCQIHYDYRLTLAMNALWSSCCAHVLAQMVAMTGKIHLNGDFDTSNENRLLPFSLQFIPPLNTSHWLFLRSACSCDYHLQQRTSTVIWSDSICESCRLHVTHALNQTQWTTKCWNLSRYMFGFPTCSCTRRKKSNTWMDAGKERRPSKSNHCWCTSLGRRQSQENGKSSGRDIRNSAARIF